MSWPSPATRPRAAERLQDAYSLRCIPQVHGAAREANTFLRHLVSVDLDAVTDNPIVFENPLDVVSAGNFHGQSLALGFDTRARPLPISERSQNVGPSACCRRPSTASCRTF